MQLVTRKSGVKIYHDLCIKAYHLNGTTACVHEFKNQVLNKRMKFPLLEFCGKTVFEEFLEADHIAFCDEIEALKTEGGNVLLGIILQCRLTNHFNESLQKASEYIAQADIWYVCDIIGERVFGYSILHFPKKTIPKIKKLSKHHSFWVIRSLGAGIHYSIKKGLDRENVSKLFRLLLSMSASTNKEIRQGVGWAAKTTAKFHPDIIEQFQLEIHNKKQVANWFRKKSKLA